MNESEQLKFSYINSIGVNDRKFHVGADLLTDPLSLRAIQYLKAPLEIVNPKSFSDLAQDDLQHIYEQANKLFMLSRDAYVMHQETYFYPMVLDEINCANPIMIGQYGLFAKMDIPRYSVLGFYSGLYIASFVELEYLLTQFSELSIARYGNACTAQGIPVICGHYHGNYMTVINDWRPYKWFDYPMQELEDIKLSRYNANSIVLKSGDYYFIAYVSNKDILCHSEIITDYGDGYWERERNLLL